MRRFSGVTVMPRVPSGDLVPAVRGYNAGLIAIEQARGSVDKIRELEEAAGYALPGAPERVRMHEIVRGLINWLVSGLIEGMPTPPPPPLT